MNKKWLVLLLILFTALVKAQDLITLKTGEQIKAKVLEVGTDEIKYKKFGVDDSPVYSLKKTDVVIINYQNGTSDTFTNNDKTSVATNTPTDPAELYRDGAKDAEKYYASYSTPGATGTFWTALFSPLGGLIPAIACSSTPPKDKNLHLRQNPSLENASYMQGYREEAFRIKKRRVWLNFGIGAAISIVGSILLANAK